jgi:hypothetical protein
MSCQTDFLVQAFNVKGDHLKADAPIACRSAEGARRTAERLALSKAGVVAFSMTSDAETGDYDDERTVFFRTGQVPDEFSLMP